MVRSRSAAWLGSDGSRPPSAIPRSSSKTLHQPGDLLGVPDAQSAAGWFAVGVLVSRQHLGQDLGRSVGIDRAAVVQDHHVHPFPTVEIYGLRSVTGLVVVALLHPASLGRKTLVNVRFAGPQPVQAQHGLHDFVPAPHPGHRHGRIGHQGRPRRISEPAP